MSEADFRVARRQKFLTEKYYHLNRKALDIFVEATWEGIKERDNGRVFTPASEGSLFRLRLQQISLAYTAGESVESLIPMYQEAARAFEAWHEAERKYLSDLSDKDQSQLDIDRTPVEFHVLYYFQQMMSLIGLGLLLGQREATLKIVNLLDRYRGVDLMFEALIGPVVADPRDTESLFHDEPYRYLLEAIFNADSALEASEYVKKYLTNWYKSFKGLPWHDGHLVVMDDHSAYEGYWAFEAAAVCVAHGIDDSIFRDHLVYPKDLADWSRAHGLNRNHPGGGSPSIVGCPSGQLCPKTGWWFTPAGGGQRCYMEAGDVMPAVSGDYGDTIWQWDAKQDG